MNSKNHNCNEKLFEIEGIPGVNNVRRFQCPKCGRVLRITQIIQLGSEWEDEIDNNKNIHLSLGVE